MIVKTCYKCKRELPVSAFARNASRADGLQSQCRECKNVYSAQHHRLNADRIREGRRARRERLREKVRIYKSARPCMDCGKSYPHYVMDFDHRDPSAKISEIANMLKDCRPWVIILEEIEKCDLVCANCHRVRTHETISV